MSAVPTPEACHLVLFGITGDLARRKLLPALYQLERQGLLHELTVTTGLGRSALSPDDFRNMVLTSLAQFGGSDLEQQALRRLDRRMGYVELDFSDPSAYACLETRITGSPRPAIFYFATPSRVYADICTGLHQNGLIDTDSQVVLEKP